MSKEANKTIIGGFIISAVILAVAAVLILGSGRFLRDRHTFVMYFAGSVKGLEVGSSVDFRGVKIGTVTDIVLRADPEESKLEIPVFVDIEPERFENISPGKHGRRNVEKTIQQLVDKGLRAQLQLQSLVTGKLMIQLDFHPDKPMHLKGSDTDYPEIPTVRSDLQELASRIEKVPIEEIFNKLNSTLQGIEKIVTSSETIRTVRSLNETLDMVQNLAGNINSHLDPLADDLAQTIKDTRNLVQNVDNQVRPLASDVRSAVAGAEKALQAIEHTAGDGSTSMYELNRTLRELSAASRSVRLLADYLSRHPEALLRGKGGSE